MKYFLSVLLVLAAGLAVSCAASTPADLSGVNPNLTSAQREDVIMLTNFARRDGFNLTANLDDFDQNGNLDLIYTGPETLKNPDADLAHLANFNGMTMAGCGYPIDKLVIHAGPDIWTATFSTAADCAWGRTAKEDCTVEKMWKKDVGI